jgi:hypothetical protein
MRTLGLCALVLATTSSAASSADLETVRTQPYIWEECLALAREEGRAFIQLAALHPALKWDDPVAEARAKELKAEKKAIHSARRELGCI